METKICIDCGLEKNLSEFYKRTDTPTGYRNNCKVCKLKRTHKWMKENNHRVKENGKLYRKKNFEDIKKRIKTWEKENYEKIRKRKNKRAQERRKEDVLFSLIGKIRCRLAKYLKTLNITKRNKTFDIVGCSPEFLKEHLEKQFVSGMTWENRSEWHIDHIIPLSSAKNRRRTLQTVSLHQPSTTLG